MGLSNAVGNSGRIIGPLRGCIAIDIQIEYPNYFGAVVMGVGFVMSLLTITSFKAGLSETK